MKKCEWKEGKFKRCRGLAEFSRGRNPSTWSSCPFCGADIKEPVNIEVGMFGKFWDVIGRNFYGVLTEINMGYWSEGSVRKNFTPGLPKGFNNDGTPK